jgi:transcriptional regulator with XRE-family HTH domain
MDVCPHCGKKTRAINGAWLRWLREGRGLDQRTLARMLDLSGPYLSDIERNRRACPDLIRDAYQELRHMESA